MNVRRAEWGRWLGTGCAIVVLATALSAQYAERNALAGSGEPDLDVSGRSIKNIRVRAVHSDDPNDLGSSAYFIFRDPYLAYQLGRNLNFREFRTRDGVFNATVSNLAGPMPDGTTNKITADNQTSCSGCHNLPQGTPGGGTNFHKDSGFGRNAPHYFGGGLIEMMALQVRDEILALVDTDASGWISAAEAAAAPPLELDVGGTIVDYGDASLDGGATGSPDLNNIFRVWYVDANGVRVPDATGVDGVTTFGYNFNMIVWGWGQGPGRAALNPTNRVFLWDPYNAHGGLQSHDPTTLDDPDGDGVSEPSLVGAVQFPATHVQPDLGLDLAPEGYSLDDPDGDGYLTEISEGDLDLAEFFMLNAPRPGFRGTDDEFVQGTRILGMAGCAECHVPDWTLKEADGTFDGDRRWFDFGVTFNEETGELEGKLTDLTRQAGENTIPRRGSFVIEGVFTDLRHHDMGEAFAEIGLDGTVNRVWRTPPLWGVGSGFPWGHDGQSLTISDAIQRHGGAAADSLAAWNALPDSRRQLALDFLGKLQLYDIESMPADIDGDGVISENFVVAGMDTGVERFNAEWLFETPVQIQGPWENIDGEIVTSHAATNIDEAYGQLLPFRVDVDEDGWPDVWDPNPAVTGYKDGVQN